jgi:hypothetical protein
LGFGSAIICSTSDNRKVPVCNGSQKTGQYSKQELDSRKENYNDKGAEEFCRFKSLGGDRNVDDISHHD